MSKYIVVKGERIYADTMGAFRIVGSTNHNEELNRRDDELA